MIITKRMLILYRILLWMCSGIIAQIPSFPGAEGYGASSIGGRGGKVIYVTNLNDSGAGSLRSAVNDSGPRTIIFRVGGTINLQSSLTINNPFITIAGQTAPGDGITLRLDPVVTNSALIISTNDVIIRHLRIRPGAASVGECCRDAITFVQNTNRVMIDHCSFSWGTDEVVNAWYDASNITIQYSIISEGLLVSSHEENGVIQRHSMGALFGDQSGDITLHHNLFAHNDQRNPRITNSTSINNKVFEIVNNVIYNYGAFATVLAGRDGGQVKANFIGNYFIEGDDSKTNRYEIGIDAGSNTLLYVSDNIGFHRPDHTLPEWNIVGSGVNFVDPAPTTFKVSEAFSTSAYPTSIQSYENAYIEVLDQAGANISRDAIDLRIINDVKNKTGNLINDPTEVGGWVEVNNGTPYTDIDMDGIDDEWENINGLNASDPEDRNGDNDQDGYTNLEEFLNESGSTLSLVNNLMDKDLILLGYPNPTSEKLHIRFPVPYTILDLSIYNSKGALIKTFKNQAENFLETGIDIHSLSDGLYFLRLNNNKMNSTSLPFIVQHK